MALRLLHLAVLLLVAQNALASDWGHWSGPNRDMTVDAEVFGDDFALEVAWTKDLGSAYSSIAVVDGHVVTAFSDGESDFFIALAAEDGAELWRYRIAKTYEGHDGSDDGPLSSPTIHDDVVYGLGPFGQFFALKLADGAPIWEKKLTDDIARAPEYGFTTAPLIVEKLLILQTGGEKSAVTAFDRATGEKHWTAVEGRVAYESPALIERGGHAEIVAATDREIFGLDPKDGSVRWSHVYSEGEIEGFAHPILVGENRLLFATWKEAILLDLSSEKSPIELWRSRDIARSYVVPVPHEGYLYGYSAAFLSAIDLKTGEKVWKSRPPGTGNLVLVDGRLVIQVEKGGELVIAEATPEEYREQARLKTLDAGYYVGPTFAEGKIFVRNLKQITAVRVVESRPAAAHPEETTTAEEPSEETTDAPQ